MTKIERIQLTDLFWRIIGIVHVLQPESIPAISRDAVDTKGIEIKDILDMVDMIRLDVKYNQLDLEACRREMVEMLNFIKSSGTGGQE